MSHHEHRTDNDPNVSGMRSGLLRRRTQSGAIFVEALLILTAQSLLFGVLLFFHKLYERKLDSMGTATAQAFHTSLKGCGRGVSGNFESPDTFTSDFPQDEAPGDGSWLGPVENQSGNSSHDAVAFAGRSYTPKTQVSVMCNEPDPGKDAAFGNFDMLGWAFSKTFDASQIF